MKTRMIFHAKFVIFWWNDNKIDYYPVAAFLTEYDAKEYVAKYPEKCFWMESNESIDFGY